MSKEVQSFPTPGPQGKCCPVRCEQSGTLLMASEKSFIGVMEAFGDSPHTIPSGA